MMSVVSDVENQLRALVAQRLGIHDADIGEGTSLIEALGADSLELVCLIMEIEAEFGIDIPDEDAAHIVTMKQLIDYVEFAAAAKDLGQRRQIERPMLVGQRHR
jgi:acyl carrier protein